MTIEELYRAICEDPERDELRLEYADRIEPSDPDHAWFIREQIALSRRREVSVSEATRESRLGRRAPARWSPNLLKLTHPKLEEAVVFDRGFAAYVVLTPAMFLEYRELVFRLAPVRHIRICAPWKEDRSSQESIPLDDILACPELARLDSFGFEDTRRLPDDVYEKIAACPLLTRCQYLSFGNQVETKSSFKALFDGSLTSKMLHVWDGTVSSYGESLQGGYDMDDPDLFTLFNEGGKVIEARVGYVPWLHPSQNQTYWRWAVRDVATGLLPKFPAGSLPPKPEWYEVPPPTYYRRRDW